MTNSTTVPAPPMVFIEGLPAPVYFALKEFENVFIKIHQAAIISGVFGIIGALLTIATVLSNPKFRKGHSHRLIALLAFATLTWTCVHLSDHATAYEDRQFPIIPFQSLAGGSADSKECKWLGFLLQFLALAAVFWEVCIAFNVFFRIVVGSSRRLPEWGFALFSWGCSFVIAMPPWGYNKYGTFAPVWCHFIDQDWQFNLYSIPVMVSFFLVASMYICVAVQLFSQTRTLPSDKKGKYFNVVYKLSLYPIVFLMTWLPLIVRIIWDRFYLQKGELIPLDLDMAVVILVNNAGFWNWCVYAFFNGQVRAYYVGLVTGREVDFMSSSTRMTTVAGSTTASA